MAALPQLGVALIIYRKEFPYCSAQFAAVTATVLAAGATECIIAAAVTDASVLPLPLLRSPPLLLLLQLCTLLSEVLQLQLLL